MSDPVTEYAQRVVDGKEDPVCNYHRLACERHLRDLEKGHYIWDAYLATWPVEFIELLKHWKGKQFAGKPVVLEPWQVFIVGSVFGWKNSDGSRRFKEVYVEVPRKNGKTLFAGGVGLFGLIADGEEGPEIYSVATKKDQASICWKDAQKMLDKTPTLKQRCISNRVAISYPENNGIFQPLSRDTKSLDGLNPSLAILDEFHAYEDPESYNQMNDAMGAREQPLMWEITTAGSNFEGICYSIRDHLISILEGNKDGSYVDEGFFGIIFTLDEGDDWRDESVWKKANPNLDVSKSREYLRRQVQKAEQISTVRQAVKIKQFNLWTDSGDSWLQMDHWRKCAQPYDLGVLTGERCYMGIDLSSNEDLTAVVCLFPPGPYPEWTLHPTFYLPEDNLQKKGEKDKIAYTDWKARGFLKTTPGNRVDYDFIVADILEMSEQFDIVDVGYDPWKATQIAGQLENEGLKMFQMRQGAGTMGEPTADFERKVLGHEFRHGGNPVLQWMARNTVLRYDANQNGVPDKKKARKRIDGIVASIMALGRALVADDKGTIYEKRGFIEDY